MRLRIVPFSVGPSPSHFHSIPQSLHRCILLQREMVLPKSMRLRAPIVDSMFMRATLAC